MSHSQFHCTGRAYLDMHGLIFETSICYWQDQPGRREERERGVCVCGAGKKSARRGARRDTFSSDRQTDAHTRGRTAAAAAAAESERAERARAYVRTVTLHVKGKKAWPTLAAGRGG